MMDCNEMTASLTMLLDGELPEDRRYALERHAAECAYCAAVLADYQAIRAVVQAAAPATTRDIWDAVRADIEADVDMRLLLAEIRKMREEMTAFRSEMAELRRALSAHPPRSTSLDLPYVRKGAQSPFQLV
jgi:anti-sigma factor RsiW